MSEERLESVLKHKEDMQRIRLLSLSHLCKLLLSSSLGSLSTSLGIQNAVPPAERTRVVANELFVMNIVVLGASPEGKEVVERPGKLVARVCVDGLEEAEDDPDIHGQDVEVLGDCAPHDGNTNGTETQAHDFNWRCVLGSETEGSGVLVVDLVNGLVEGTPVERAMHPVVPCILEDEKDCDLVGHLVNGREGNLGAEAKVLGHRVEEPGEDSVSVADSMLDARSSLTKSEEARQ